MIINYTGLIQYRFALDLKYNLIIKISVINPFKVGVINTLLGVVKKLEADNNGNQRRYG